MKNLCFYRLAVGISLFLTCQSLLNAQLVVFESSADINKSIAVAAGSTENNATVVLWEAECQLDILWRIVPVVNGQVKIQNVNSGKFLATDGGRTANGTPVILYQDNSQQDILWYREIAGTNIRLKNIKSGKYLCVEGGRLENGARLVLWENNNQRDINWLIKEQNLPDSHVSIFHPCTSQLVAAVADGSTGNNAEVILWSNESQDDAHWLPIQTGMPGYYKFKNNKSGKYLGVEGGFTHPGAKIVITPDFGQMDVFWKIIPVSKYAFKLQNRKSNLFLAVSYGKLDQKGINLVQWNDTNQVDIRWCFDQYIP
jgi:hypothetical protein